MPDAARLAQLVRLLASDKDGERLAAVAAIDRALKTDGLDFHDLAAAVERGWLGLQRPKSDGAELKPWQAVAQACLFRGGGRLTATEMDFCRSMVMWPGEPSDRQQRWLSAIALSLGIEARAAA